MLSKKEWLEKQIDTLLEAKYQNETASDWHSQYLGDANKKKADKAREEVEAAKLNNVELDMKLDFFTGLLKKV